MGGEVAHAPLAKWLGVKKYGAYEKAEDDADWAFEPLNNMWSEEVEFNDEDDSDSDSNDEDDGNGDAMEEEDDEDGDTGDVDPVWRMDEPLKAQPSTKALLRKLYKQICDSVDKLFFVAHTEEGKPKTFRIAQVDLTETDPMRSTTLASTQSIGGFHF